MESAAYLSGRLDAHEPAQDNVIAFEQHGVFIHLYLADNDEDRIVGGTLRIIEKDNVNEMEWKPDTKEYFDTNSEDTEVLSDSCNAVVGCSDTQQSSPSQEDTPDVQLPSLDGKDASDPDWTVVADNDRSKNVLRLESVNSDMDVLVSQSADVSDRYDFTIPLDEIRLIKKSKKGSGWRYLTFELADGVSLPSLYFHEGGCNKFLKALNIYIITTPSPNHPRALVACPHNQDALTKSFDELNLFDDHPTPVLRTNFIQKPVTSAWSGFSKVTNFLQDILNPAEATSRPAHERATIEGDVTEAVGSNRIQIKREGEGNGSFEVITCADLGPRREPPREKPMDVEFWNNHKDPEGRVLDEDEVKIAIFNGGVDPSLRKEVWKYLLNYFPWGMTRDELKEHKRQKEDEYYVIKLQWKSIQADQENRFTALKENKCLIDKDVTRTDRTRSFYEGDKNVSLKMLNDILVTYVMYNFDLGYVQGMNDLLSPILEVMGSEVDAFWCFVGFMNIVQHNFERNQSGMKKQLQDLRTLIQFLDPKFFDSLSEKESSNLYFCFRWLLLRFKREFSFQDIQTLWEVMWTGLPCPNYHLVICVALLDSEKEILMQEENDFTEILKHINDLSCKIDLDATLRKAEGIYLQLSTCRRDLSESVCDVLGLSSS